jgi:CheY-like chemotaxis protein
VLVADDHPDIVKAVSLLLALDCAVVGSVTDGSALLETARRLQPDVIVLNVNLPNVHSLPTTSRHSHVTVGFCADRRQPLNC